MDLRFSIPGLDTLDALHTETLCVGMFEDERPPRGVAGLVDWRLAGRVSRLLGEGRLSGQHGEVVLVGAGRRIAGDRVLVFGLGARSAFDERRYAQAVDLQLQTLLGMKVRSVALALPGRSLELITPERAIEMFLAAAYAGDDPLDEVVILDSQAAHRSMQPLVDRERRRAAARFN